MEGHVKNVRHGHTTGRRGNTVRSMTYNCWRAMIDRCRCPSSTAYRNYGAKGITVCDRWLVFTAFAEDMGERPSVNHTLDRIDNSKGYLPENCRWATRSEQNRNRKNVRFLTANGITLPLVEWAERIGINPKTLHKRIHLGWSDERIVAT